MDSEPPPYVYTRWANPRWRCSPNGWRRWKGRGGIGDCFGDGGSLVVGADALSAGDHLVASEVCYVGSVQLFAEHLPRFGIQVSLVDTSDPAQVQAVLCPNTRLIYAETPANPVLRISDVAALAELAHRAGIPLAIDSTFGGPALQRPLALGADYVVHSLTKFLNGHGDALGGAILGRRDALRRVRREMLTHLGGAASPFNAWLILRGLVTLPLRMERHSQNALAVARFLESNPQVERVFYPGLESHPHHAVARRQMSAFGGMVTMRLKRWRSGEPQTGRPCAVVPLCHVAGAHAQPVELLCDEYLPGPRDLPQRSAEGEHPRMDGQLVRAPERGAGKRQ